MRGPDVDNPSPSAASVPAIYMCPRPRESCISEDDSSVDGLLTLRECRSFTCYNPFTNLGLLAVAWMPCIQARSGCEGLPLRLSLLMLRRFPAPLSPDRERRKLRSARPRPCAGDQLFVRNGSCDERIGCGEDEVPLGIQGFGEFPASEPGHTFRKRRTEVKTRHGRARLSQRRNMESLNLNLFLTHQHEVGR